MSATSTEELVVRIARQLRDGSLAFLGVASGVHHLAFRLAQETTCPRLSFIEGGGRYVPPRVDIRGNPRTTRGPVLTRDLDGMIDLIDWRPGVFDVAMLGGIQVDRFGNVNTIAVGPWDKPVLRGPGAIGAGALAALATETHLVVTEHSTRNLVDEVDNCSGFGHFHRGRDRPSLAIGTRGPVALYTPLATFVFEGSPRRARVRELAGATNLDELAATTGFEVRPSELGVRRSDPPSDVELTTLRRLREDQS